MISEFIKPSVSLVPEYIKLPPLDQIETRFIAPQILVFRVDSLDTQDSIVRDLQDGLATTIKVMPFIAADVIPDDAERGTIQLEIGEDAGVWFHVQEVPELNFEVLLRQQFAPVALPVVQLMPEPRLHNWERSPVLTIQATFITGGLLLVFNSHHSVMDGKGMSTFVMTWAKHVLAASEGRLLPQAIEQESLDRTPAFGNGNFGMQLSDFPSYRLSKQGLRSDRGRELLEATLSGDMSHPSLPILRKLHISFWSISSISLHTIRQAAPPSADNAPMLTDSAVLSALLWRHITRARQLLSRGIGSTSIVNVVNVRRRLEPPLPLDYSGNALAHAKTTATVLDVESAKTLYELARQITDSIDWWTSERILGLIGAIDSVPHVEKVEPALDGFLGPDLEITNTGSFGDMMQLEWGPDLGKVLCMRFPYAPIYDGWVNVLPSKEGAPVECLIALDKTSIGRLREDKEWIAFAKEYA